MAYRRAVLEMLKWTDPLIVLRTYSFVDKVWLQACSTDELWLSFCEYLGLDLGTDLSAVETYREERKRQLFLPILNTDSLQLLNCRTRSCTTVLRFQRAVEIPEDMAVVLLPCGKLLFCGGFSEQLETSGSAAIGFVDIAGVREAGIVDEKGNYAQLQNMLHGRAYHSLIYYDARVYTFGGAKTTAEKLQLSSSLCTEAWQALPDMLFVHIACTPCLHAGLCYLFGGNTDSCETFSPAAETFTPLSLILPEALYGCAAVRIRNMFVILSTSYVTYWKPGEVAKVESNETSIGGVWSAMRQCIYENILFSCYRGAVRMFNLTTRTLQLTALEIETCRDSRSVKFADLMQD